MNHHKGMSKYRGRHHHTKAITALLLSWHMLAKDLTPSSAFWLLRQLYDPSVTSSSWSSHGQGRTELGTLPLVCDFFASLWFVPVPCAAVHLLFDAFFHPSHTCFLPSWQGTPPKAKQHPKCFKSKCWQLCVTQCHLSLHSRTCRACTRASLCLPFVTRVQEEKGNLTPDIKEKELCLLWSIFKQHKGLVTTG